MEQEKLINEKKSWLFEQIRSEYAALAKKNRIFFWILCAIFGIFLIQGVLQLTGTLEPFDTKKELSYIIFYVALLMGGLYTMIASNKMAKAETPENLLVTYNKIKKIGVWTCIIVVALLVISMFLKDGFSKSNTFISCLLLAWISIVFFIAYSRDNQIKKLRDLIQKS